MKDNYCVMTFHSTHHALNFEKALKTKGYDVRLMPVPRQVSSSCGTAAEFPCDKKEEILKICIEMDIEIDNPYTIENKKGSNWFSKFLKK
ncbi:DUF3343 domain-containing protein [Caldisalinibacter kiritimatiensis]|uniref:Putative Se/S carrier protein-like domain-containing protein n=1 Tax=Caldisalinibacter kiritimatiensis TaxID=1304284 RepID=R1AVF2_9FIRM|nr:DUF3343 domain-containing protein [Caldisalinibacter kiritimatiensis]EOD01183.1 hypothetical protein L21TH_0722 [Caldisalinibacter kiritimatiensis]